MSRQVYFEHDSRGSSAGIYRPPMGRQRKFREYPRGFSSGKSRVIDADGDVDMGGAPGAERRYNPYAPKNHNRKKHKKQMGNHSKRNRGIHSDSEVAGPSWFRITIPFGKNYGKMFILKSLTSFCKSPINPINFQFNGNSAEFFLENQSTARQVREVNRKVTTPEGFKMVVHMSRCAVPTVSVDPDTVEMIKNIMSARYDAMSHCLDLSEFQKDKSSKTIGLFLPLNKPIVMSTVAKIIKEHIPELEALDISNNKLYTVELLSSIVPVCKQLKSLNLKANKLRSVSDLNCLKGLGLVDLVLDGNILCDDFKDKTVYISAVRERFPKLRNLDGAALPEAIGFDLGPETLPASKKSFFAADDVKDMVIQFLDQYYTIYDSGDRSKLLDAYHDQANFSLCLSKNTYKTGGGSLGAYNCDNRNLLRVDSAQGFKLLKQGKLSIVKALSEFPQTMHDPSSFSVDIFHVSPGLMSFSVVGVFKEVGADINNATLKTFYRTYVVTAQGQGFVITNETLFIAHASQDQQAKAFKVPAPTPSPSPAPSTEEKSTNEKQLMVIELSKQTGMNLDFSSKCLEENDWDYQRAASVFLKFQSEGKLPPEAFIPL